MVHASLQNLAGALGHVIGRTGVNRKYASHRDDAFGFCAAQAKVRRLPQRSRNNLQGQAELILTKQRTGFTGLIRLVWIGDFTRFEAHVPLEED